MPGRRHPLSLAAHALAAATSAWRRHVPIPSGRARERITRRIRLGWPARSEYLRGSTWHAYQNVAGLASPLPEHQLSPPARDRRHPVRSRVPAATWGLAMSPLDCRCQVSERAGQARPTSPDTQTPRLSPRLCAGVVSLAAGGATCALLSGGSLECWGDNSYGGLGIGDTNDRYTPTEVMGLGAGWRGEAIVCARAHVACACTWMHVCIITISICMTGLGRCFTLNQWPVAREFAALRKRAV